MKVGIFINTLNSGGAERLSLDLATELKAHSGIEPILIVAKSGGTHWQAATENKIPVFSLDSSISMSGVPAAIRALRRFIIENDVDIIHSHLPYAHLVSRIACRVSGVAHVSTYHNVRSHKGRLKIEAEYRTQRFTQKIICVSNGVRNSYPDSKKMTVIYNGINVGDFAEKVAASNIEDLPQTVPNDKTILLHVGRCVRQKRQSDLIEMMTHLDDSEFHLIIVGEGPLRKDLEKKVSALELDDCVSIAGYVESTVPYYSAADIFVSSSENEGLPTTHVEAMAAKLPIVSTAIPGVKEIVGQGETGYLCPVGDPSLLADAVLEVLRTGPDKMGSSGRAFAEANLSIQTIVERHVTVYNNAYDMVNCL